MKKAGTQMRLALGRKVLTPQNLSYKLEPSQGPTVAESNPTNGKGRRNNPTTRGKDPTPPSEAKSGAKLRAMADNNSASTGASSYVRQNSCKTMLKATSEGPAKDEEEGMAQTQLQDLKHKTAVFLAHCRRREAILLEANRRLHAENKLLKEQLQLTA